MKLVLIKIGVTAMLTLSTMLAWNQSLGNLKRINYQQAFLINIIILNSLLMKDVFSLIDKRDK